MNAKKKPRICVVTYPRSKASITPLSNIVNILSILGQSVYLLTGNQGKEVLKKQNNITGYAITYKKKAFLPFRLIDHAFLQIKLTLIILWIIRNIDLFVFYMGEGLTLPILVCKCIGKPVIMSLAGSLGEISKNDKDPLSRIFVLMENMNYSLTDRLVIYSNNLINEWKLQKYSHKIMIAHEHYFDFNRLKPENKESGNVIGFIGRFSEEKGILNFIKAIPLILQMRSDVNFTIGGDGPLKNIVVKYLTDNNLLEKVKLSGWIDHETLPGYFGKISLLVLPSYTEGLPNIMLEAMACGTPVLATRVGAIIDVINNNDTGLLMKNNSPECISENVVLALQRNDLDRISHNALNMVKNRFSFHKAVEDYENVLRNVKH
jgi:glycosyltransferase involved in cell wall biosynthesis